MAAEVAAAAPKVDDEGSWLPLESNPAVLNPFATRIGMPKDLAFCDVYGTDDGLLAMVPQPVKAVMLLFPSSKAQAEFKAKQAEEIKKAGQDVSKDLFYLTQLDGFGNACGTIACIHALANSGVALTDGPLSKFVATYAGKTADEIGTGLLSAKDFREMSDATAEAGDTDVPAADAVDAHFIAFVEKDGTLYELDGRKQFPINHGKTENLLKDACGVIKKNFMAVDPESMRFNIMALAKSG